MTYRTSFPHLSTIQSCRSNGNSYLSMEQHIIIFAPAVCAQLAKAHVTYPSQLRIRARGLNSVALPPKLLRRGFPHSLACNASHLSTSRHACSLFALWILMMLSISYWFKSSFFHRHPLRSIAFQNICWLGYTQNSFEPSSVTFGMLDVCRSFGNGNGWSGAGFWLPGGIYAKTNEKFIVWNVQTFGQWPLTMLYGLMSLSTPSWMTGHSVALGFASFWCIGHSGGGTPDMLWFGGGTNVCLFDGCVILAATTSAAETVFPIYVRSNKKRNEK